MDSRGVDASVRFLAVCLVLGLALRLVLAWLVLSDVSLLRAADQVAYLSLADRVRTLLDFGWEFGGERMPVYPAFLALVQAVTGSVYAGPIVVQNLLGVLAVWACWKMGALFSRDTANLAGGVAALNLNMAVYANQMLTESLFLPVFAWGLYLLCRYVADGRARDLAWPALTWGGSVLVRSATMYLPLFVLPWLALRPGGGGLRRRAGHCLLFLVLFLAAMSPWVARNEMVYGHPALTSQGTPHLTGWVVPSVARFEEGTSQAAAVEKWGRIWREHEATLPEAVRRDPFALTAEAKRFTVDYMRSVSPLSIARAWFWGAARNIFVPVTVELSYILDMDWSHFSDTGGSGALEQAWNFLAHNDNPAYALMLAAGLVLTLALRLVQAVGAVVLWRDGPWAVGSGRGTLLAMAVVTAYFLAVSGPVGYAKYRLPLEPVFVLLTAVAAARLRPFRHDGEGGRA